VFWTPSDGDVRISRDTVDRVEFERIHLAPFWWATSVRFRQEDDRWSSWFVAFRPGSLRRELERLAWPVTAAPTVGYGRLLARRER
jgi:hypothetical protein